MSLGAASRVPLRTRRQRSAATSGTSSDPARRTATTHGNPRATSRPPVCAGATTRVGLGGEAAWIIVSRRLLPTNCTGCRGRGATTGGAISGFRTDVALGGRSAREGEETSTSSGLTRGTRPGREATRGLPDLGRSVATRGGVGVGAGAVVATGNASSGAATVAGAGASDTSTGGVSVGASAAGAGAGAGGGACWAAGGAGAGCGAGAGLGAGCGEGAGGGGGAGAARGGSSVSGSR
jgi:hypothetical protein